MTAVEDIPLINVLHPWGSTGSTTWSGVAAELTLRRHPGVAWLLQAKQALGVVESDGVFSGVVDRGCFQESAGAAVGGVLERVVGGEEDVVDADDVDGAL
jgi:hypothetical protein